MLKHNSLTQETLKSLLSYDYKTGIFTWIKTSRGVKTNVVAGRIDKNRREIKINTIKYFAHRLAWLYVYGEWPIVIIDHINGNGLDNRIENLRIATPAINARNKKKSAKNTSGYNGVTCRSNGKFQARIRVSGRKITIGTFANAVDAHMAFEAEKIKHGFTIDHGIR